MPEPLVTVIIATYNRASIVPRAVRSVQAQTRRDWKLLVVDDASPDDTESAIRSFEDDRIHYIRASENGGASRARNIGLDRAQGRYIAFLDDDDEWLPKKLERQIQAVESSDLERVGAVICGRVVRNIDGDRKVFEHGMLGRPFEQLLAPRTGISTSGIMLTRASVAAGIRFDESLTNAEDHDLLIQVVKAFDIECVPEPLYILHRDDHIERMYDAPGIARGVNGFLRKYDAELRARPFMRAMYYRRLAFALASDRKRKAALVAILKSVRARPFDPRVLKEFLFLISNLVQPKKRSDQD